MSAAATTEGSAVSERARRWRLVLGRESRCATLSGTDQAMDSALEALYNRGDRVPGAGRPDSDERGPTSAVRRPGCPGGWGTSGSTSRPRWSR